MTAFYMGMNDLKEIVRICRTDYMTKQDITISADASSHIVDFYLWLRYTDTFTHNVDPVMLNLHMEEGVDGTSKTVVLSSTSFLEIWGDAIEKAPEGSFVRITLEDGLMSILPREETSTYIEAPDMRRNVLNICTLVECSSDWNLLYNSCVLHRDDDMRQEMGTLANNLLNPN